MRLADLKARYPDTPARQRHFLVTEVTQMGGGDICVAAVDLQRLTIVRPLQWNHRNWPAALAEQGLKPGRIIRQSIRKEQEKHGYPHETEDAQLTETFDMVALISQKELYEIVSRVVDDSVTGIFADALFEDRYVLAGTRCRSLGSILVTASTVSVYVNSFGKVRCSFTEQTGRRYELPVTDLMVVSEREANFSTTMKRIESATKTTNSVVLRIGLARAFDGNGQFNPKRCYIQVNGIIFPE